MNRRQSLLASAVVIALGVVAGTASAQNYPSKSNLCLNSMTANWY